ncbi:MAG: hypothetical protein LUG52_03665 [Clostridia bacterium]|nr:hypothetical protein [Clostridia bacterium]
MEENKKTNSEVIEAEENEGKLTDEELEEASGGFKKPMQTIYKQTLPPGHKKPAPPIHKKPSKTNYA